MDLLERQLEELRKQYNPSPHLMRIVEQLKGMIDDLEELEREYDKKANEQ